MKKIIKHAAMTGLVSIAMATGAFAGGTATGVEPGGGCGDAYPWETFSAVNGAPYKDAAANLTYSSVDNGTITFTVNGVRTGNSEGTVAGSGKQVNIGDIDAFLSLQANDLKGYCLTNVEFTDQETNIAEVRSASRLIFNGPDSATVVVRIEPIILDTPPLDPPQ